MDHKRNDEVRCYRLLKKLYPVAKYIWLFNRPMPYRIKTPAGWGTSQPDVIILDRNGLGVVAMVEMRGLDVERVERLLAYKIPIHLVTIKGGVRLAITLNEETASGVAAKRNRKLKYTLPIYVNELVFCRFLPQQEKELKK